MTTKASSHLQKPAKRGLFFPSKSRPIMTNVNLQIQAKVIKKSISAAGVTLTTMQLQYPRFIHSEFLTHRTFSRNASSSRAIPVGKMIEQVRNNPAMPIHWGLNKPGMQADVELTDEARAEAIASWQRAASLAAHMAELMADAGLHKQVANRILEPFQLISVIVTATEWDNFFELRLHRDAQPEIRALAEAMYQAYQAAPARLLSEDQWHLPYVKEWEFAKYPLDTLIKASAARCARVSYLTHDGKEPNIAKDVELYDRLVGARPIHASPVEHQARPLESADLWSGNFRGWWQHRKDVEIALG